MDIQVDKHHSSGKCRPRIFVYTLVLSISIQVISTVVLMVMDLYFSGREYIITRMILSYLIAIFGFPVYGASLAIAFIYPVSAILLHPIAIATNGYLWALIATTIENRYKQAEKLRSI